MSWVHSWSLLEHDPAPNRCPKFLFLQSCRISLSTSLYLLLSLWFLVFCCFWCWRWLVLAKWVFLFGVATLSVRSKLGSCLFFLSFFWNFSCWFQTILAIFFEISLLDSSVGRGQPASLQLIYSRHPKVGAVKLHLGLTLHNSRRRHSHRRQESEAFNMSQYIFLDLPWHKPIWKVST